MTQPRNGRTLRVTWWVASAALGVAAGCDRRTPAEEAAALGAIAVVRAAATGATCLGNGAHGKHVQDLGLDCAVCHPGGPQYGFANAYAYPRGTTSAGGTVTRGDATTPTTCSVGCHSPMGAPSRVVSWTAGALACTACHETSTLPPSHPAVSPATTRAECESCHAAAGHTAGSVALVGHDASAWMSQASAGFHAFQAERGLARCRACHAQDLTGGATGVSCGACHDRTDASGTVVSWKTDCAMCHGGMTDPSSAAPRAIWGYGSDAVRVGAHASHVKGSAIAPAVPCEACHVKPADALAPDHVDELTDAAALPKASLAFGGLAAQGGAAPAWDRASATCASTYCHGATLSGGTNTKPTWTVLDGTQAACGTCHGTPPGGTHPAASGGLAACNPCHPATIDPAGGVIPPSSGGKHLDGLIEASGHPAAWIDTTSGGFHAFSANQGLTGCKSCHGADLSGGSSGVGCGKCHDQNLPAGVATWSKNCTMCHGGADDATGAPPKATWGNAADAVRVGAHGLHVAKAIDCGTCHVKPADALSDGHVDGATATVTFAGMALVGAVTPTWSRAGATCASTYCHGAFAGGNAAYAPVWTAPAANACGTCHGLPPGGTHPTSAACERCHDGYTAATVNAALHVNGAVEVLSLTCASCHGDPTRPATAQNPQLAAAPPQDSAGNQSTTAPGVGAHQRHLRAGAAGNAIACTECHAVPTSMTHASGAAEVTFGPLASASGAVSPAWSAAALTCASTYCHGGFRGGNAANVPAWTAARASACGTCHGLPPDASTGHPQNASCGGCHRGYTDAVVDAATHLDGRVDVSGGACTSCHGDETRTATALNPALPYAPPVDTKGSSDPASPGVGAHQVHLNGSAIRGPLACTECHAVPADMSSHPSGATELAWGSLATGAITASLSTTTGDRHFDTLSTTAPSYAAGTCASTYCHGSYSGVYHYASWDWSNDVAVTQSYAYAGLGAAASWTGGTMTCGSCHGNPPAGTGTWHTPYHGGGSDCSLCHPDAAGTGADAIVTNPAVHADGKIDLSPAWSSSCFGCH